MRTVLLFAAAPAAAAAGIRDLSPDEFRRTYLAPGVVVTPATRGTGARQAFPPPKQPVDWTSAGGPIHNQGESGSAVTFAAVDGIAAAWFVGGHKPFTALSQDQMNACGPCSSMGCMLPSVFKYAEKTGLATAACYTAHPSCALKACPSVKVNGTTPLGPDEAEMVATLQASGPFVAAVDASEWQMYTGGVLTGCAAGQANHAVLVVGYGIKDGQAYWLLKNSWGSAWGEDGYIRVAYGADECGIADNAVAVTIA